MIESSCAWASSASSCCDWPSMSSLFPEPAILVRTARWLAVCAAVIAVSQHVVVSWRDLEVPGSSGVALVWGGLHIGAAVLSVLLGAWILSSCFPGPRLHTMASNPAAALQESAHALAAGSVAASVWGGCDPGTLVVSAVFWVAGLFTIVVIAAAHRVITRYQDHRQIADGNVAAALASAGLHVAIAIIVSRAMNGPFLGWKASFVAYGFACLWVLALLPVRQLFLARIVLRQSPALVDDAIAVDRRLDIAGSEALAYLVVALGATTWA